MDAVTLYSTWPSPESAETAARLVVERRLIACANILPGARSIYRWDGAVQAESEAVMFAKTTAAGAGAARDALVAAHPYDCPCVVAIPLWDAASHVPFLTWAAAETS